MSGGPCRRSRGGSRIRSPRDGNDRENPHRARRPVAARRRADWHPLPRSPAGGAVRRAADRAGRRRGLRICPKPRWPVGRMLATKTTVHVADLAAELSYTEERDHPLAVATVE